MIHICHVKTDVTLICLTVEGTHDPYIRSVCKVMPQRNKTKVKAAATIVNYLIAIIKQKRLVDFFS